MKPVSHTARWKDDIHGQYAAIDRATCLAVELLGGNAFIGSPEVSYLFAAARGLSLHPPARPVTAKRLAEYLAGSLLILD